MSEVIVAPKPLVDRSMCLSIHRGAVKFVALSLIANAIGFSFVSWAIATVTCVPQASFFGAVTLWVLGFVLCDL